MGLFGHERRRRDPNPGNPRGATAFEAAAEEFLFLPDLLLLEFCAPEIGGLAPDAHPKSGSQPVPAVYRAAERVGFEPTVACTTQLFESCTFGRSDTAPSESLPKPLRGPHAGAERPDRQSPARPAGDTRRNGRRAAAGASRWTSGCLSIWSGGPRTVRARRFTNGPTEWADRRCARGCMITFMVFKADSTHNNHFYGG